MPTTYPRDRFDEVREDLPRVGAHRAPPKRGRALVTFFWAAFATGVLVAGGVFAMHLIETNNLDTGASAASSATKTASVTPTIDAAVDVVLLNATTTNGLAASAKTQLTADGWHVESTANASSTSVKTTTVYYSEAGQAGAALGLAKSLGFTATQRSSQFAVAGQNRLTVVLGKDYADKQ